MTNELMVPVSAGELIDKITILQIKSERIQDPIKLENVVKELNLLKQVWKESTYSTYDISQEKDALYEVNSILWEIEDGIRDKERQKTFDSEFIDLARKVYRTNDLRANIKKTINDNLGSNLSEEKSYQPY